MYSVTAGFKTKSDDPQQICQKKFTFIEGVTDYTAKLLDMGSFSQRQFEGHELSANDIQVTLLNDAQEFNGLITDKTNITKIGKLELGFDGEFINRYRGYLSDVEFFTEERPKCRMTFASKAQRAIERSLGSISFPIDYVTSPPPSPDGALWSPADLAWDLLTVRGDLDSTASTANVDIDYTSWLAWKNICVSLLFRIQAYFTGQSIAEALRLIGELTDTLIFAETDGKFYFKRFVPSSTAPATPYLFTEATAHLQGAKLYFNKGRIINQAKVWYQYDPLNLTWAGSVTKSNTASKTNYGLLGRDFSNIAVWHFDISSATSFGERLIDRYKDPAETVVFTTRRGTQAIIHQMGDPIRLTWSQVGYVAKVMKIYGISARLSTQEYTITAEVDPAFGGSYFILDHATLGKLDNNKIF